MSLRVLVVDDEAHAREDLGDLLSAAPGVALVETADGPNEALVKIKNGDFDAVFLDIRMPGLDGLALAEILHRFSVPPAVVFVSAYDDHAVDAFAVDAVDYLLKPVNADRLDTTLARLRGRGADPAPAAPHDDAHDDDALPFVGVEVGGKTVLIERAEIRYAEAEGDYVRLHTHSDRYLVRRSLTSVAEQWGQHGFVRIHRSYVVNLRHVADISPFFNQTLVVRVKDADGTRLPVSRRRARELRDLLGMTTR